MSKLKKYFLDKKYIWLGGLFLIWMIFFDTNSFLNYLSLNQKKKEAIRNIDLLKIQIREKKILLEKINSNPSHVEKIAREKFYMKKKEEDLFIVK